MISSRFRTALLFPVLFFALVCSLFLTLGTAAGAPAVLAENTLRSADKAINRVTSVEQAEYRRTLKAWKQALQLHPGDAALALAQCEFTQRFAWSENLAWSEEAGKDYEACLSMLEARYLSDAQAGLFVLEHRQGKVAIALGERLGASSANWSVVQQSRFHAALSQARFATGENDLAGEQAVLSVRLDPSSNSLVPAIRYLAKKQRVPEALRMLAAAPVASNPWIEATRIDAAVEVLPPAAGRDELKRAQQDGLKINAWTVVRALRRAGDAMAAQKVLAANPSSRYESAQNSRLRVEVALEAHDASAAAAALQKALQRSDNRKEQLLGAYARLVGLSPAKAFSRNLMPMALLLLSIVLFMALLPGALCFPVHYRGTVRARIGKSLVPVFGSLGLRHAWLALSIMFLALYAIPLFLAGRFNVGITMQADWPRQAAILQICALICMTLGLAWLVPRLSWREWLGRGKWDIRWFLWAVGLLAWAVFSGVVARYQTHVNISVNSPDWQVAGKAVELAKGAYAIGGLPFALVLMSVIIPVVEEFVFRGCLLGGLSRHLSFGWANFLQAVLFATMHRNLHHWFFLLLLGWFAGWLTKKTRGLSMPVVLHALNNAVFVLLTLR